MKFTEEQRAHIDAVTERRLLKDRRRRDASMRALIGERDRLAAQVAELRAAHERGLWARICRWARPIVNTNNTKGSES